MPTILVSGQGASQGQTKSLAGRLALRGRRRKMVVKLLHYINVVQGQDFKELATSAEQGYNPLLVLKGESSPIQTATTKLKTRCQEVLALTY